MWHVNAVNRSIAAGYYDRDGDWVDGAPNGYYDAQRHWIATTNSPSASGYYDPDGQWVPASASGYYDANGQWVAGAASGYYDDYGRWIAGPAIGRYDDNGVWVAGRASGHRDADGVWVADAQTGYYDNGRWVRGAASGYYDAEGRWVATAPSASGQGSDAAYRSSHEVRGPGDLYSREARLEQRIRGGLQDGSLSSRDGRHALRALNVIRGQEMDLSDRDGALNARDQGYLQSRLDDLNGSL